MICKPNHLDIYTYKPKPKTQLGRNRRPRDMGDKRAIKTHELQPLFGAFAKRHHPRQLTNENVQNKYGFLT